MSNENVNSIPSNSSSSIATNNVIINPLNKKNTKDNDNSSLIIDKNFINTPPLSSVLLISKQQKQQNSIDNLIYLIDNKKDNNDMPSIEQSLGKDTGEVAGIFNEAILNSSKKVNSDNQINYYIFKTDTADTNAINNHYDDDDDNTTRNMDDPKIDDNNEFMTTEKTEDLIAKALKIALEEKKELLKKTELDKDQDQELIEEGQGDQSSDNMMMPMSSAPSGVATDAQGLILPKKIVNPCLESSDRQNLHRELMFNQKIGKNVLNQKSELQRALEKQKERQLLLQQKLQEEQDPGLKGELNRVIMERAQKLERKNQDDDINSQLNPEYLNARAKLRARVDTK